MDVNVGMSLGVMLGLGGAFFVVAVGIVLFLASRGRSKAAATESAASAAGTDAAASSAASAPATGAAASGAPTTGAPTNQQLERLLVEVDGMILGAVPPYGVIQFVGTMAHFTAQTRIVAAAGDGVLGGDASSTMQSLGSMEMGEFTCDLDLAGASIEMEPGGEGVRVVSGDRSARFAAVAGDHGRIASALRHVATQTA